MTTKERIVDRGRRRGRELYLQTARELRLARRDRDVTLRGVASAVGISASEVSRIERGLLPAASLVRLAELASVVGLELRVTLQPGGQPLRDQAHVLLLERLHRVLHRTWRWATEVPLPRPGDPRAWDVLIALGQRRYGIEAETAPTDAQALVRRLQLKLRDGAVDGVILLLPATRRAHAFLREAEPALSPVFSVPGRRALELLRAGVDPGGSSVIVLGPDPAERERLPAGVAHSARTRG